MGHRRPSTGVDYLVIRWGGAALPCNERVAAHNVQLGSKCLHTHTHTQILRILSQTEGHGHWYSLANALLHSSRAVWPVKDNDGSGK